MTILPPTSDRHVFKLLWRSARRRAMNRRIRQRELMTQKKGRPSDGLVGIGNFLMACFMTFAHVMLGWSAITALDLAKVHQLEAHGQLVIPDFSKDLLDRIPPLENSLAELQRLDSGQADSKIRSISGEIETLKSQFAEHAGFRRTRDMGGNEAEKSSQIRSHLEQFGSTGFTAESEVSEALEAIPDSTRNAYSTVALLFLPWWFLMLVFQGEGMDLDLQRRRHPMWEWVLSHPVRPVAAFAADLLAPLMANPVYLTAPIFWWVVFGSIHGPGLGLLGALVVGLCCAVAASCLNKALEISAMLRLSVRNRGAVLGLMSWFGYAALMLGIFSMSMKGVIRSAMDLLARIPEWIPTSPTRLLLIGWGETSSLWQAVAFGVTSSAIGLTLGVIVAWWGLNQGLQASEASSRPSGAIPGTRSPRLLAGSPLYRKELLWFWRDKGAVVQAILIPLTIASFQVFNLRGLLDKAIGSWNGICGAAVICGTYFLIVLGPRSLASEGSALWIPMTWPKGMEDLLKAKARLWWMISNGVVGAMLLAAFFMFPNDWLPISLVAIGWSFFGRSLAEKTVTLVTAPSSSGEVQPAPKGRQWAVMVGTLSFGTGVMTQNWSIAMVGVVFSALTAAAMWQNFRARLPYLFDPWSEKLPPAPSLMHAMIGIALMVEVVSLSTGIALAVGGADALWQARAFCYGLVGIAAWLGMHAFLTGRGVSASEIWRWDTEQRRLPVLAGHAAALVIGATLAGFAMLYLEAIRVFPLTRDFMVKLDAIGSGDPANKIAMLMLSVGMAPLAEEYFFRGLLYRALDREWGGWKAMVGSAAYFAMYHPPVSWLPVFLVGLANAWLFKKSGRLLPCVILHMAYNAIVVGMQ